MAKTRRIKSSEVDFGVNSLPKNRTSLFFSLLKRRFLLFFGLSLLSILFIGPAIVFETISRVSIFSDASIENLNITQVVSYILFSSLISLALNFVLCMGFSGLVHILQNLAHEKIVFVSDFFKGIKENILLSIFFTIFLTLGYSVYKLNYVFSIDNAQFNMLKSVGFGFSILLLLTIIIMGFVSFIQNTVYKLNFRSLLTNSFNFYLKGLLIYALITIVSFFYIFAIIFGSVIVDGILGFLLIILSPEITLVFVLYTDSKLDKFINKEHYPELVDIGINRVIKK